MQIHRGYVDGHGYLQPSFHETAVAAQCAVEYPAGEPGHQPAALDEWNEHVRADPAAIVALPAGQDFGGNRNAGCQVDLRLEYEVELVRGHRDAQRGFQALAP